jgi:hypothetical protein
MTDKEYIEGFLKNDEKVISSFYRSYRFMFTSHFMSKYRKDEDYVSDLFQDSCITIWSNITNKKLTPDNLTSSLSTYLISVGRFTMMAKDRKYKEIIGKARKKSGESAGNLEVSFFWIFYSDYKILELDSVNYSYALVGSDSDKYLWILSRTPKMKPDDLDYLLDRIVDRGYDINALYWVTQP